MDRTVPLCPVTAVYAEAWKQTVAAEMATERDHRERLREIATDRRAVPGEFAVVPFPSRSGCCPGACTALLCGLTVAFPVTAHEPPPGVLGAKIRRRMRLNSSSSV